MSANYTKADAERDRKIDAVYDLFFDLYYEKDFAQIDVCVDACQITDDPDSIHVAMSWLTCAARCKDKVPCYKYLYDTVHREWTKRGKDADKILRGLEYHV